MAGWFRTRSIPEHLPLLLGAHAQLDNVGPVRALALNAPTAREALATLLRYARKARIGFVGQHGVALVAFQRQADAAVPDAGLARIFHACSQRRAQRGIAARI